MKREVLRFFLWVNDLPSADNLVYINNKYFETDRITASSREYDGALNELWNIYCEIFNVKVDEKTY